MDKPKWEMEVLIQKSEKSTISEIKERVEDLLCIGNCSFIDTAPTLWEMPVQWCEIFWGLSEVRNQDYYRKFPNYKILSVNMILKKIIINAVLANIDLRSKKTHGLIFTKVCTIWKTTQAYNSTVNQNKCL